MRVDRPLLLMLAALTAGCADPEPFVEFSSSSSNRGTRPTLEKPLDPVLGTGTVTVCYSDQTAWGDVEKLAQERCSAHGLVSAPTSTLRWQCRATSPHRATFRCYDPEMRNARGFPINPFDPQAVAEWERRTGKKAKPHNFMAGQAPAPVDPRLATPPTAAEPVPVAPPPAAIPSAPPPPPARPLTPADIAGRPPMPAQPQLSPPLGPPPAPGGAYPMDGFTLPQGSWGDHFQE